MKLALEQLPTLLGWSVSGFGSKNFNFSLQDFHQLFQLYFQVQLHVSLQTILCIRNAWNFLESSFLVSRGGSLLFSEIRCTSGTPTQLRDKRRPTRNIVIDLLFFNVTVLNYHM